MVDKNERRGFRLEFCKRLRRLRIRAGFQSQAAFAGELGIPQSTYQQYEQYRGLPLEFIPDACEILGVGPWLLLTGQSDQFAPPLTGADKKLECLDACEFVNIESGRVKE